MSLGWGGSLSPADAVRIMSVGRLHFVSRNVLIASARAMPRA